VPIFEMQVSLPVSPDILSADQLIMSGVNYELFPVLRMSSPKEWSKKAISEWPVNSDVFSSIIFLFGFIPIDVHHFKFISVNSRGFKESSKTTLNSVWLHERTILTNRYGSTVKDVVSYKSRLSFLGYILKPVYESIFVHRHKRLKLKYGKNS
jgi:hypothetical protein